MLLSLVFALLLLVLPLVVAPPLLVLLLVGGVGVGVGVTGCTAGLSITVIVALPPTGVDSSWSCSVTDPDIVAVYVPAWDVLIANDWLVVWFDPSGLYPTTEPFAAPATYTFQAAPFTVTINDAESPT